MNALRRLVVAAALIAAPIAAMLPAAAQGVKVGGSGQPVPRFVSLKSDAVNVRRGPSGSRTWSGATCAPACPSR